MNDKGRWRAAELGERGEVQTDLGPIRYFSAGDGPPVVLVHGVLVNANLWRKVVPRLAESGLRAITLELPLGSHERPARIDGELSPGTVAAAIIQVLDELDLENVTLVGNDTGGALCQLVVTTNADRIGRLVLTSCDYRDNFPPKAFDYLKLLARIPGAIPPLMAPMRIRRARRMPLAYGWLAKRPIDKDAEDSYLMPVLSDRGVRTDLSRFMRKVDKRDTQRAADLLGGFGKPALVAWSKDDKFFPPAHAKKLAEDLGGARVEMIEDSYTFSMEDQPERLSELISAFARESAPAAA
jgi:pimeloyl-ACP methyl ester carboxylesterase